jgi:biopolymer transport protein ExbD
MKFKGRNKVSPEFSMSSMTDIVFLLLIFFMLTSNAPNALDMILPSAKGKSTNTQNVSVSIKKNSTFYVNKKRVTLANVERELIK